MLTLPVYRALPGAAQEVFAERAFVVRETTPVTPPKKPRLLDRVRAAPRARHCGRRTEKAYVAWIERYTHFLEDGHDIRTVQELLGHRDDTHVLNRGPAAVCSPADRMFSP